MKDVVAMIQAGVRGERLSYLTALRSKPAVPFAGKYRIIDFTLSNCVNSDIYTVGVLTQYQPHSLIDHIGLGKPWDLDRQAGGVRLLQPYMSPYGAHWYQGTADAIYLNLDFLRDNLADLVLIVAGDHVYNMDYHPLIAFHRANDADATVATIEVSPSEASRYGVAEVNDQDRIIDFVEKPSRPRFHRVSMGIYVFKREVLIRELQYEVARTAVPDFGRSILPRLAAEARLFAYAYHGYWHDIDSIDEYYDTSLALLDQPPALRLNDPNWVIHTRSEERAPARVVGEDSVTVSLVSHGCLIDGTVERSILSPGVRVESGAIVRDSIVMGDTYIGRGAVVDRCILDKEVWVGPGAYLGWGAVEPPTNGHQLRNRRGLTIVGKRSHIPEGLRIGRACELGPELTEADFGSSAVAAGTFLEAPRRSQGHYPWP